MKSMSSDRVFCGWYCTRVWQCSLLSSSSLALSSCVNTFNKPGTRLHDDNEEKVPSTPPEFAPIDDLLNLPRVKRSKESSALSKYPPNALYLYRRNVIAMAAFSAASMGTAALLLLNSPLFREWLSNSGLL